MPELQRLRADHGPAVLAFELANRAYFAVSISDRGDDFYDQFAVRLGELLAEQEAGAGAFICTRRRGIGTGPVQPLRHRWHNRKRSVTE